MSFSNEFDSTSKYKAKRLTKIREVEKRFKNINIRSLRRKLKTLGAKKINPKKIMPLIVFYHPNSKKKKDVYIRIRDEGNQITMTTKTNLKDKYPIENEVNIDNFEQAILILLSLGCKKRYYVEKIRETWILPGCKEIVIDSYPGLADYIEIDCHSEVALFNAAKKLRIKIDDNHKNPQVDDMYMKYYGITKNRKFSEELTFKNGLEVFKKYIKKDKKKFIKILKEQQKYYNK